MLVARVNRLSAVLLLGGLVLAWALAREVLIGGIADLGLALLGLLAIAIAVVTLSDWRVGVYLLLAWLVFEDLPRKYLGNNMVIYFGKDALAAVAYFSFFWAVSRRRERSFRPPFGLPLLLFVCLGIVQVANTNSPSMLYGLLGLKVYFYYIPLMFLGYALVRSIEDLERFMILNLAVAGAVALVGIIQATVNPDFLNPQTLAPELELLGHMVRSAPSSNARFLRPASVFVSDGRFASYLYLMFVLALGIAGSRWLHSRRARRLGLIALGHVVTAIILSGSRGSLVSSLGSLLVLVSAFLWGASELYRQRTSVLLATQRVLASVGVVFLVVLLFAPEAVGARWSFYYETLSPSSPWSEVANRGGDYPIRELLKAVSDPKWLVGHGTGTASLGGQYITSRLGAPPTGVGVESGYGNLIVEMGILGPVLWLGWTIVLLMSGWQVVRRLKGTSLFLLGFAIWWFVFMLLFPYTYGGMQAYQNFVLNAYLWLLVGLLFRLPSLCQSQSGTSSIGQPRFAHGR